MTEPYKIIEVKESVFADNDREAARLRVQLKQDRTFLLNLMSSPGSGKTTTLLRTLEALKDELRIGVMEADIDSDVDAKTIADAGVKSIQLHTGGMCHLDASMTEQGLKEIGTKDLDLVVLENVGNLVCPAEFDTGAVKNAMILSVPEGHDKPLKYPLIFTVCDALIINKIDTVKKEELLPAIDTYRKICDFAEIIPCSALRGNNTQDIIPSIFKYLPYGPMFYDEDTVTDQPQRQIAAEIIREKALHALDEEIPHGIAVAIDRMKKRPGRSNIIDIDATIICERNSHKGIIIGKQGSMLKKIGSNARYELERMLEAKVNLKLWVKVTKNWRDSDFLIKNFGYDKKEI